jgi:hypothetical protein
MYQGQKVAPIWNIDPVQIESVPNLFMRVTCYLNGVDAVIPTRPFSPSSAARVKMWRKYAKQGELPPVLAWYVSGLDSYIILDGHDRLHAALIEAVEFPVLVLRRVSVQRFEMEQRTRNAFLRQVDGITARHEHLGPKLVDQVNKLLMMAYDEPTDTSYRTCAWPLPGGAATWGREVRSRFEAMGVPVPEELFEGLNAVRNN